MDYFQPQTGDFHVQSLFLWRRFVVQTEEFALQRGSAESCTWPWGRSSAGFLLEFLLEFLHPPGQEGTVSLGQCGTGTGAAFGSTFRVPQKGDAEFLQAEPSPWCSLWIPAGSAPTPALQHCCPQCTPWGSPGPPAPLPAVATSLKTLQKKPAPNPPNPSGSSADPRALLSAGIWLCSRDLALKNPKSNVPRGCPEEMQIPEEL